MKDRIIAVTGGTGLVGREVVRQLVKAGREVVVLSRSSLIRGGEGVRILHWDGRTADALGDSLRGVHAIIHLAGENVGQRWTRQAKSRILESRVTGGEALRTAINGMPPNERPALVAASAIGWYADSAEWQDERSPSAEQGFLAEVVRAWEGALEGTETRHVTVRIGMVLSRSGGALAKLEPLFRWGIGSAVGSGRQWQSWIHVRDLARLIVHATENETMHGVYNAVAPDAVTNAQFSKTLAQAMGKPFWAPAPPAWLLRALLGEMAHIALDSQRIRSVRMEETKFAFDFPRLTDALSNLYAK